MLYYMIIIIISTKCIFPKFIVPILLKKYIIVPKVLICHKSEYVSFPLITPLMFSFLTHDTISTSPKTDSSCSVFVSKQAFEEEKTVF